MTALPSWIKFAAPAFETPPGVTMRPLAPGEVVVDPVLVCAKCRTPQIHDRETVYAYDNRGRVRCRCRRCGEWRQW